MIVGQRTRLCRLRREDVVHRSSRRAAAALPRRWGDAVSLPSPGPIELCVADGLASDETPLTLVVETHDGAPVGWLGVEEIDGRHRSALVVLHVVEPDADEGYGRDALAAVCRYLFEQHGLHRIGSTVPADDDHAVRLYEQLGFRSEGVLRGTVRVDGALRDEILMSLLTGELRA